jgi:2-polyprenyl-3-methyl-5-hydroxy-6-metoxy-1,4-benzoquinol methylase
MKLIRRREVSALRRELPARASVLEVGCAAGDLLVPMRDAGFQVTGVELSDQAATLAREEHQLEVHTGSLADAPLGERSFDAVIMRNVIEHLPDPKADLQRAAHVLRPGGLLLLKTDNVASLDRRLFGEFWYGFDFPRHLTLFSRETLTAIVAAAGLRVARVSYSLVPTHWIMSLRYLIMSRGRGDGDSLTRFVTPRNPLLLGAGLSIALVQKLAHDSGRFGLVAVKPGS